jgi:hypothetical protein
MAGSLPKHAVPLPLRWQPRRLYRWCNRQSIPNRPAGLPVSRRRVLARCNRERVPRQSFAVSSCVCSPQNKTHAVCMCFALRADCSACKRETLLVPHAGKCRVAVSELPSALVSRHFGPSPACRSRLHRWNTSSAIRLLSVPAICRVSSRLASCRGAHSSGTITPVQAIFTSVRASV